MMAKWQGGSLELVEILFAPRIASALPDGVPDDLHYDGFSCQLGGYDGVQDQAIDVENVGVPRQVANRGDGPKHSPTARRLACDTVHGKLIIQRLIQCRMIRHCDHLDFVPEIDQAPSDARDIARRPPDIGRKDSRNYYDSHEPARASISRLRRETPDTLRGRRSQARLARFARQARGR